MRDLGEKDHFDIEWRRVFATGQAEGPQLLIAGRIVTRTGGHGWYFARQADGPDEVRRAVREQLRAGVDLIKVMLKGGAGTAGTDPTAAGYTREEIVAAVEEAHAGGRKIAGHGYAGGDLPVPADGHLRRQQARAELEAPAGRASADPAGRRQHRRPLARRKRH